jgi:hypothetical protein
MKRRSFLQGIGAAPRASGEDRGKPRGRRSSAVHWIGISTLRRAVRVRTVPWR